MDEGKQLTESSTFNANCGTVDKKVVKDKLYGFIKKFVDHLVADKGKDSSLCMFCCWRTWWGRRPKCIDGINNYYVLKQKLPQSHDGVT